MASLQSDSASFRIPLNQQQIQQPHYMICLVTNKPIYHRPCTYNLTPRGCKFGQSCWFQHFIQQPPPQQQQQQLYTPTTTTPQQIDLTSLTNQLSSVITKSSSFNPVDISKSFNKKISSASDSGFELPNNSTLN